MDNSIGIYIHIPFCKSKCHYCDFHSFAGREHLAGPYFHALFSEMRIRSELLAERPVRSIFIGGGTPSLVEPSYIEQLLDNCRQLYHLDPSAEISIESNPGTLSAEKMRRYRAAGINRLSIGLQAWQDPLLKDLGRIHTRQQYIENVEEAVRSGFKNINTDLIFGLPGQSFHDWAETLEAVTDPDSAAGSALTHLSCYSLKIEEGTVFGERLEAGTLKPAEDELDRQMYHHTVDFLAGRGYQQYELSNFAKPGADCAHNMVYWKAREYAGFGSAAHSYLNDVRFGNPEDIDLYMEGAGLYRQADPGFHEDLQQIGSKESMSEFMILGLRLTNGVESEEFLARYGISLEQIFGTELDELTRKGLLTKENLTGKPHTAFRYRLTPAGLDLANQVFMAFL